MSKSTQTQAGQTTSDRTERLNAYQSPIAKQELVDAITQLFAEFELVYHNQYSKAFGTEEKLSYAKRLWYSHLKCYNADIILKAVKIATRESEYLPSVYTMLNACDRVLGDSGIPTPAQAYKEACLAPAPKARYKWTHPIVYLAGKDTGWQYLHETQERFALPTFSEHYQRWRAKLLNGDVIEMPQLPSSKQANTKRKKASPDEKLQKLNALRDQFSIK